MRISILVRYDITITMLPLDLLNELLGLVDDSSTFYSIALASKVTNRFAENQNSDAVRRYYVRRDSRENIWTEVLFLLPNGVMHGPGMPFSASC